MNQDIMFAIDSSNRSSSDFANIKSFIITLLNNTSPSNTRIALVSYASSVTMNLSLSANISVSSAISILSEIVFENDSQINTGVAMEYCINDFATYSASNRRKLLFLFQGEKHIGAPCSTDPAENDIFTYVIAGNSASWNPYTLACLVSNWTTNGFSLTTFNTTDLNTIQSALSAIICPSIPQLRVTEIQPITSGNSFIELFNFGFDISSAQLQLNGLFTGILGNSVTISQGQYLVITNNPTLTCSQCSCTLSQNKCNEAEYLNGTIGSVSNGTWFIEVKYNNSLIDYVSSGSDLYWTTILDGYTLEKRKRAYNGNYGSSWVMSCLSQGTPGAAPLSSCSCSSNVTCNINSQGNDCISGLCNCVNDGYYSYQHTCNPLPPPSSCLEQSFAHGTTADDALFDWTLARWHGKHLYQIFTVDSSGAYRGEISYGSEDTRYDLNYSYIGNVSFYYSTIDSSTITTCTFMTAAPTSAPTPPPTYSIPKIPSCNATLQSDSTSLIVYWEPTTVNGSSEPPSSASWFYRILVPNQNYDTNIAQCCDLQISLDKPYNATSDYVAVGVTFSDYFTDSQEKAAATICTISTLAPTSPPSSGPTTLTSQTPGSSSSSGTTTPAPTYSGLNISYCMVNFTQGYNGDCIITFSLPIFNPPYTASQNETNYWVSWNNGTGLTQFIGSSTDGSKTFTFSPMYDEISTISMYPQWRTKTGALVDGSNVTCTISTQAPTPSPTNPPTPMPIIQPTKSPIFSPTNFPTKSPTPAPTYILPIVEWCSIEMLSGKALTVYWPLVNDTNNNSVPLSELSYSLSVDGDIISKSSDSIATANDTLFDSLFPDINITNDAIGKITTGYSKNGTVCIAVEYSKGGYSSNSTCCNTIVTHAPTPSPIPVPSPSPTIAPTFNGVHVYFSDSNSMILNCTTCTNRCFCDSSNTIDQCHENYIPHIKLDEIDSSTNSTDEIIVKRDTQTYPYDIIITWRIKNVTLQDALDGYLNETAGTCDSYYIPNDTYWNDTSITSKNKGPTILDVDPNYLNGSFTLFGASDLYPYRDSESFYIRFPTEPSGYNDYPTEVFFLELTGCQIINPGNNRTDNEDIGDILNCTLEYPSSLFVFVNDKNSKINQISTTVTNKSWLGWFPYVMAALVLLLLCCGFCMYRFWVNNKMSNAAVKDVDSDEQQQMIEDEEAGFGHDIDPSNVQLNPLAPDVAKSKGWSSSQDPNQKQFQEQADVKVDKFNVRQEFGPQHDG